MKESITSQLIGTWQNITYDDRSNEQRSWRHPYGEHPLGYLVYDSAGNMFIQIMKTPLSVLFSLSKGWEATPDEAKAALKGYIAYFGKYSVDEENKIDTHHVKGGLVPNYIGTDQKRPFSIEGNQLILSDGKTWRREFERAK